MAGSEDLRQDLRHDLGHRGVVEPAGGGPTCDWAEEWTPLAEAPGRVVVLFLEGEEGPAMASVSRASLPGVQEKGPLLPPVALMGAREPSQAPAAVTSQEAVGFLKVCGFGVPKPSRRLQHSWASFFMAGSIREESRWLLGQLRPLRSLPPSHPRGSRLSHPACPHILICHPSLVPTGDWALVGCPCTAASSHSLSGAPSGPGSASVAERTVTSSRQHTGGPTPGTRPAPRTRTLCFTWQGGPCGAVTVLTKPGFRVT